MSNATMFPASTGFTGTTSVSRSRKRSGNRRGQSRPLTLPFPGIHAMSLGAILLIVLVLFLVGALPRWPHSTNWGYYPSGGVGIVIIVVIVLLVMGRI
jgi:hypothetical protein